MSMMLTNFFNNFSFAVKEKIEPVINVFHNDFNFIELEKTIISIFNSEIAVLLKSTLGKLFSDLDFHRKLKILGGKKSMRFKGYKNINIRLMNGQVITINSPYFVRSDSKRGRKKRGPNGRGCHLGLQLLGFMDKYSLNFVDVIAQMSILCPSAEIASECLSLRNISVGAKTIIKFTKKLGLSGIEKRGKISFSDEENYDGKTLVIGIDGGRIRERKKKRGKRKIGLKQQGYHSDWKEPKLVAMYLLDDVGKVVKNSKPVYDATMGNHIECFDMLEKYLVEMSIYKLNRIVFCGDGAPWIWNGISKLCKKLDIQIPVHEVIDYTHAKQNLSDLLNFLPDKLKGRKKVVKACNELLFSGKIEKIKEVLSSLLKRTKKRAMLKKWENYFLKNKSRMQYDNFKKKGIPTGSGFVESAIRRVINLRLKSAGTFWKKETAESFLFLRSQLLSGRWKIFMKNLCNGFRVID